MLAVITGRARCDLTAVPENRMRQRLATVLSDTPNGAQLVLDVGALAPHMPTFDVLLKHTDRIWVEVQGEPRAVRAWVAALKSGDILAASGWTP